MRPTQRLACGLVRVGVQQSQPFDERRRGRPWKGPHALLELECALEQPRRHTLRAELREAELPQEEGQQNEVVAVLDDLSRLPRQPHRRRRSVTKKRRQDARHDDLRLQPRIALGLDERLLEEALRFLEIVGRALAEPPQHGRAFRTGLQLLEQRLEDRTRSLNVAARVVMVGREQLPAAPEAIGSIGRREPDREFGELSGRPRCATQGCGGGRKLQLVGDFGRRSVRAESKVPGALLRVADQLCKAAMKRSPPTRLELRFDTRRQQRVAETNTLVVQLHDPRSLRRPKTPEHRRWIGRHGLDERDRRLAE